MHVMLFVDIIELFRYLCVCVFYRFHHWPLVHRECVFGHSQSVGPFSEDPLLSFPTGSYAQGPTEWWQNFRATPRLPFNIINPLYSLQNSTGNQKKVLDLSQLLPQATLFVNVEA